MVLYTWLSYLISKEVLLKILIKFFLILEKKNVDIHNLIDVNEHWTNFQESFYVVPSDHVALTSSLTLLYFM